MSSIFTLTNHEVFVITANGSKPAGFTATWVLPASLVAGTPRLLILASPENHTTAVILESKRFVIHLLADDQAELLPRFGLGSSRDEDKFDGIASAPSEYGPIIKGVAGYHLCDLATWYDMGERYILIGDVKGGNVDMSRVALQKNEAFAALPEDVVAALGKKHKELGQTAKSLYRDF